MHTETSKQQEDSRCKNPPKNVLKRQILSF